MTYYNYNPDEVDEPGFPYLAFCPIEVYDPDNHDPATCQFCQEEEEGEGEEEAWCPTCGNVYWAFANCPNCG